MNSVNLIGVLASDPQGFGDNNAVVKTRIAVKREYRNSNGQYDTDFFQLVAFKNVGIFMLSYLKKGELVALNGKLTTSSWNDTNTGVTHTDTSIIVNSIERVIKKATTNQ